MQTNQMKCVHAPISVLFRSHKLQDDMLGVGSIVEFGDDADVEVVNIATTSSTTQVVTQFLKL